MEIKRRLLGYTFKQNGKVLDRGSLTRELRGFPEAKAHVSAYRAWGTVASVSGLAGGFLVGWPIGRAAAGDPNPPWYLAGIGAGAIAFSIPFGVLSEAQLKKGVVAYNDALNSTALGFQPRRPAPPQLSLHPITGGSVVTWSLEF